MRNTLHWPVVVAIGALALLAVVASPASAGGKRSFKADLDGYQQVPSFSTTGTGELRLTLSADEQSADYEISWENIEGFGVPFVHFHIGRPGTNGGTIAFLCSNSPPRPDTPLCPTGPDGSVQGTLDASRIVGPTGQGLEPGAFEELVDALRAGAVYVNVHTDRFSPGEIRGDIKGGGSDDEDSDSDDD